MPRPAALDDLSGTPSSGKSKLWWLVAVDFRRKDVLLATLDLDPPAGVGYTEKASNSVTDPNTIHAKQHRATT